MGKATPLVAVGATSVHDLTDDLLELVLLSLDSSLCLVRAAASCKHWRRLVAGNDGTFLGRFRSLHPPQAIGTFYSRNRDTPGSYGQHHRWPKVHPVSVPLSGSASAEPCGLIRLSLDFVPPADGGPRELVDGCGSLLLLLREKSHIDERPGCMNFWDPSHYMIPDLVVCEPLTRKYKAITPPDDPVCILGAFLLDGGAAAVGKTNFRVLLVRYHHAEDDDAIGPHNGRGHGYPSACVFTCGTILNGGWDQGYIDYENGVYLRDIHLAGRTGGRIYWVCKDEQVMVLDERTLEFSTMALSDYETNWQETLEICGTEQYTVLAFPYTLPWPPVMCACVEQVKEEERNIESIDCDLYDFHVLFSMAEGLI